MRVCKCPQLPILAHASGSGGPASLLSAQGTQMDVWRLGVANDRQQQVAPCSLAPLRRYHGHLVQFHMETSQVRQVPPCHGRGPC